MVMLLHQIVHFALHMWRQGMENMSSLLALLGEIHWSWYTYDIFVHNNTIGIWN